MKNLLSQLRWYDFLPSIIIIGLILLTISGCSSVPYAKVGIGYKVDEEKITWLSKSGERKDFNDPITARFELGFEGGAWSYGVSHDSQYFTGAPFNDDPEYSKTELFLDYKYVFRK